MLWHDLDDSLIENKEKALCNKILQRAENLIIGPTFSVEKKYIEELTTAGWFLKKQGNIGLWIRNYSQYET